MRIALSQSERWSTKAAEWNQTKLKIQDQQSKRKTKKKMEDDINEFLKIVDEETKNLTESSNLINKTWMNTTKDRGEGLYSKKITQRLLKKDMNTVREREIILITDQRGMSTV